MAAQSHEPEPVVHEYLWPCNVAIWDIWCDLQTQWRHGMAGPTGLDYAGVRASPAFRSIPRADREAILADVCVMERSWLSAAAEIRKTITA